MTSERRVRATHLFAAASRGDRAGVADLTPLVYDELRGIAAGLLRRERRDHTLQPTALVHEAFLRLIDSAGPGTADPRHFACIAAGEMRRVLVDHARAHGAEKRGGKRRRVTLYANAAATGGPDIDVLALDEALVKLAALDERQARVVELRYFGGLTIDEIARELGLSQRSIHTDWSLARAFLFRELAEE